MALQIGTYTHQDQECRVGISRTARLSAAGDLVETSERWTVDGLLVAENEGDSAAQLTQNLTTKMTALEAAYRQRNVDLTLTLNGIVHNRIRNADTIGGIRVVNPPSYEDGSNAQGVTYRTYSVVVEADIKPPSGPGASDSFIVEWQETLSMYGGGPLFQFTNPLAGMPVKTTIQQNTPYFAEQSGMCIMRGRYYVPVPIFGRAALMQRPRIDRTSPQYRGGDKYVDYRTTWSYLFGSPSPLAGEPRRQPQTT